MKTLALLLVSFFIFSCTNDAQNEPHPTLIIPELVLKGNLFGAGEENISEQNKVISSQTELDATITQMNLINIHHNIGTMVNFETHKVIAIFDKVQTSGGFGIEISSILETENQIQVTISHTSSGENAVLYITQPFLLVKIPQTNKPIFFI